MQTLGEAGYTITGTSGDDQTGLNFANQPEICYEGLTPGFWKNDQNWSKVEIWRNASPNLAWVTCPIL